MVRILSEKAYGSKDGSLSDEENRSKEAIKEVKTEVTVKVETEADASVEKEVLKEVKIEATMAVKQRATRQVKKAKKTKREAYAEFLDGLKVEADTKVKIEVNEEDSETEEEEIDPEIVEPINDGSLGKDAHGFSYIKVQTE